MFTIDRVCPCKPFVPSLMFLGKARAYLSEAPFRAPPPSRIGPWPYPQTKKACQGQTLKLIVKIHKL